MKSKFEDIKTLYVFIFIIVCSFFIISSFLLHFKIWEYKVFNGIVVEGRIIVYVDKEEKKLFFSNRKLYIAGDNKKFEIDSINNIDNHYEISLCVAGKYKNNDVVNISVLSDKIYFYKIFDVIWR